MVQRERRSEDGRYESGRLRERGHLGRCRGSCWHLTVLCMIYPFVQLIRTGGHGTPTFPDPVDGDGEFHDEI